MCRTEYRLFLGHPGTGKKHPAVALARKAIRQN
ncbi:MAG: ATP-binding protein [Sphingomonadales bacterium]|nr:ATP-binding protein [Sphingomonadales bacterium]